MSDAPNCPKCGADTATSVDRHTGIVRYKCMKMRMGCDFMGTMEQIREYGKIPPRPLGTSPGLRRPRKSPEE